MTQIVVGLILGATPASPAAAESEPTVLIDVRGGDGTATQGGLVQHIDLEVKTLGFDVPGIDRAGHPFQAMWTRIQDQVNQLPAVKVGPGLTTGFGVTSLRVSFSAWPEGTPLVGPTDPPAWRPILSAVEAFKSYEEMQAALPPEEREGSTPERHFLRYFNAGGAFAFRAAWFCAALPYVTEIEHDLGRVPSLEQLEHTWCDASLWSKPQLFMEDDFGALASELPGRPREHTPDEILAAPQLADRLVSFRRPSFDLCGAERVVDASYLQELLAAGWIPKSIVKPSGISASELEARCSETVNRRLVMKTEEALRYWAEQGQVLGHNPWLDAMLASLTLEQKDQWRMAAKEAPALARELADSLTPANGYTETKLVPTRDLNVRGMLRAAAGREHDGEKLRNLLLRPLSPRSAGESQVWDSSPYVRELRRMSAGRAAYLDKIRALVTSTCVRAPTGQPKITSQCLYDSVIAVRSEDVARIELYANGALVDDKYGISGVSR